MLKGAGINQSLSQALWKKALTTAIQSDPES